MKQTVQLKTGILISVFFTLIFSSCYEDNMESLNPGQLACDTSAAVTYTKVIQPLMQAQCVSGCHSASANQGGVTLDSYASVKTSGQNGQLLGAVLGTLSLMPKGGSKLSDCQITQIKKWIASNYIQ